MLSLAGQVEALKTAMKELYSKVSHWEALRHDMELGQAIVHEAQTAITVNEETKRRAETAEFKLAKAVSQAEAVRKDAKDAVDKATRIVEYTKVKELKARKEAQTAKQVPEDVGIENATTTSMMPMRHVVWCSMVW